jgi:hypothetical protein
MCGERGECVVIRRRRQAIGEKRGEQGWMHACNDVIICDNDQMWTPLARGGHLTIMDGCIRSL